MGRKCRADASGLLLIAFALMGSLPVRGQGTILPPGRPGSIPPPDLPDDQIQQDLERRRERLRQAEEAESPQPSDSERRAEKRRQGLIHDAKAPRPHRMTMAATIAYPKIKTAGSARKDYTAEPTMLFHTVIRLGEEAKADKNDVFTGLRIAPFGGKGRYQNRGGTYGFVYFGPMIGVGKISFVPPEDHTRVEAERVGVDALQDKEDYSRTGWLALGGLAMQSRFAEYDRGNEPPAEDFNSKSVAFDGPGLWGEFLYGTTYYNAISVTGLAGIQLGKNKTFIYLGVTTGLWY